MFNIFNGNAFDTTALTDAINVVPNSYGRLNELGLFTFRGVTKTSVAVEFQEGVLHLLQTAQRGSPDATQGTRGRRHLKSFTIPHIPHEDVVLPEDVQGVRRFGSEDQVLGFQEVINDRLLNMANKHFITWEYHRAGAICGEVIDANGATLLDLFEEFGVTEKVVNFDFAGGNHVHDAIMEILRHTEDSLLGEVSTGIRALCSPEFFDALITHPEVEEAYKFTAASQEVMRRDLRRGFEHKGIIFEEYRGRATYRAADGSTVTRRFIPAGEARFVPMGTRDTFRHYGAPADFNETVNTVGLPLYAKQKTMDFDRGVKLHTQSNPLFLCTRPALLVRGVSS